MKIGGIEVVTGHLIVIDGRHLLKTGKVKIKTLLRIPKDRAQ